MRMMAIAMIVFLVAIGWATILESNHDIQTAKILIYNAKWFEILLAYLTINLVANIFRYKMFSREKIALLAFHLSFIVIILGAWTTRYLGFEGLMLIREGTSSNFIYAADPHFWFKINDGKMQYEWKTKAFMSEVTNNYFEHEVAFPGHKTPVKIAYVDFKKKQIDSLIIDKKIKTGVLDIVTEGKKSNYVGPNGFTMVGDLALSYEKKDAMPGIEVFKKNGQFLMRSKIPLKYLPMEQMIAFRQSGAEVPDSMYQDVPSDSLVPFQVRTLYLANGSQFVFNREIPNAEVRKMSSGKKDVGMDILTMKVTDGTKSKIVELEGGISAIPSHVTFEFNGLIYEMEYGSTKIDLPFSIACRDFQLDKYPGSEVASSFASEVTVIDPANNVKRDQRIFMNNVMDYGGYRFFQSSYDLDNPQTPENEEGTRLSVNYDFWGTNITYLGYLLMSVGMILSLFAPAGRFRELIQKLAKSAKRPIKHTGIAILFVISSQWMFAQTNPAPVHSDHAHDHAHDHDHTHDHDHDHTGEVATPANSSTTKIEQPKARFISTEHAEELAHLLVQDYDGRIVPFHTLADKLLRKIYGKQTYEEKNAVQTVMSMLMYPDYWDEQKVISVPRAVREQLKLDEYASFQDLNDAGTTSFKWMKEYNEAHNKLESKRGEFDKKIIKLVEDNQVFISLLSWDYFRILPVRGDANHTWVSPMRGGIHPKDSVMMPTTFQYLALMHEASENGKWGTANDLLQQIKQFQREVAADVVPSQTHVDVEIAYNKMNIFKNASNVYILVGFALLAMYFVQLLSNREVPSKAFQLVRKILTVFMLITFVYHGAGLGMRWYVSGHAPWSNGYEAIVFIAWGTVLFGLLLSRYHQVILGAAAILAYFMIFVSELNLLDPEITPLQPVLKSYWLMIHVAIITTSYAALGLSAILSLVNLVLYIIRGTRQNTKLTVNVNQITYVSEMVMTIGLFMLTIGTFLGGIWANESWGRYWGWDPKETWALVSILVYAVILHLRFIPSLNGKFLFNAVAFWGFTSILFTFFGVNFYLVGLHSYAQGDGLAEFPDWIVYTALVFALFTAVSAWMNRGYKKNLTHEID